MDRNLLEGRSVVQLPSLPHRVHSGAALVTITEVDRRLVKACIARDGRAWTEFLDRFLPLFLYVVRQSASLRSIQIDEATEEDLAAEILSRLVDDDFKILKHFRGKSKLSTYLTVVARRVAVNHLARLQAIRRKQVEAGAEAASGDSSPDVAVANADEVRFLLDNLKGRELELVRAYYVENKTYSELAQEIGIPENSIGPTLGRIREKLRNAAE